MRTTLPGTSAIEPNSRRRAVILFALLCLFCTIGVLAYALHSRERALLCRNGSSYRISVNHNQLAAVRNRPHLLFRDTALGPSYGRLSVVALDAPDGIRYPTDLECERVYGSLDSGVCLQASRGVFTTYSAVHFDKDFQVRKTFGLPGTPSRTRVSSNGRYAGTTVFVRGDSYNAGGFSTRTSLFDLRAGELIADLESFTVSKDGIPFKQADFNFWGVTFHPDDTRFFATLGSGGVMYLVEGSASDRTLRILREGVECPSLSPDGSRVAFKSRETENGRMVWKIRVLNLSTEAQSTVSETRSVDDQVEWLDEERILYAIPRQSFGSASSDIWLARADGNGGPELFLKDAFSPCVIRP